MIGLPCTCVRGRGIKRGRIRYMHDRHLKGWVWGWFCSKAKNLEVCGICESFDISEDKAVGAVQAGFC